MAKREVTSHTKFKRLKRALGGIPDYSVLGLLEYLWHVTARETRHGDIGKLSNEDIADAVCWDGDPDELIGAFVSSGWLDRHPTRGLVVHGWSEHCDDSLHAAIARRREWFADGTAPRLIRLNSTERKEAEEFYKTHSAPVEKPARQKHSRSATGGDEATFGERSLTDGERSLPNQTMPDHAEPTTPKPPRGAGSGRANGNGHGPPTSDPEWPEYRNAMFLYFGRDARNREWDDIHENLAKYHTEGLCPPLDGWRAMCKDLAAGMMDERDEMPKTLTPLLDLMATEYARQRGDG